MTTVVIDLGDLRQRVADEVYAGVQDAVARVERDFGVIVANALRGAARVDLPPGGTPVPGAEAAPLAAPSPPVPPAPANPLGRLKRAELPDLPEPPLKRQRLTPAEIGDLKTAILGALKATRWLTAEKLAARIGVPSDKLPTPLAQLRGLSRGKPTGQAPQIQAVGEKRTTRYALVGTPLPAAPKKPPARTRAGSR